MVLKKFDKDTSLKKSCLRLRLDPCLAYHWNPIMRTEFVLAEMK